jgi:hypothetical protein
LAQRSLDTDRLVEQLVAEVRPVRRLLAPAQRAALWTAVAAVCVLIGVLHFGVRRDIATAWFTTGFLLRVGLLLATMWLAVVTAFRLSVPGRETGAWSRWWPIVGLGALMAVAAAELVAGALFGQAGSPLRGWTCMRKIAFVGAVPAAMAVLLIQRAAALEPRWTALLGVLAAGAAGGLTSELACPINAPMHIFLWHALPVALSAGLGAVAGSLLLGWLQHGSRSRS